MYCTYPPLVYPASGSSADYTYGVCGVKYSYGVELRDTGTAVSIIVYRAITPKYEVFYRYHTMALLY